MKRCPKCQRFGVEYDFYVGKEKCLWNDCPWINDENINLDDQKYPTNFSKFRDAIKKKDALGV